MKLNISVNTKCDMFVSQYFKDTNSVSHRNYNNKEYPRKHRPHINRNERVFSFDSSAANHRHHPPLISVLYETEQI